MAVRRLSLFIYTGIGMDAHSSERYVPDVCEAYDLDADGNFLFRSCICRPLGIMTVDTYGSSLNGERIARILEEASRFYRSRPSERMLAGPWLDGPYTAAKIDDESNLLTGYWKLGSLTDSELWKDIVSVLRDGMSGSSFRPCVPFGPDGGEFAAGVGDRYREKLESL